MADRTDSTRADARAPSLTSSVTHRAMDAAERPHHADVLSFMKRRWPKGTGTDYWLINPTGDYSFDCAAGGKLATEYLTYIGEHPTLGNGTLLSCIVREMMDRAKDRQEWSGVHVGFLAGVNRYAMAAARVVFERRGQ